MPNIIFDVHDVLFTYHPEHKGTSQQLSMIKPGIEILLKLAGQVDTFGRKQHRLYILSNGCHETYANLAENFPTIVSVFDGIVTSAHCGLSKPDYRIYEHIIHKYNLTSSECIFIDDKQVNVLAAKSIGMDGIICSDHTFLKQELIKRNVL